MDAFISSLIGGFEQERAAAAHAAEVLRWKVLRAEDFGARIDTPRQACLDAVRQADVVLLLLGERYGEAQDSGLSATHEEWRESIERNKPVLVFVQSGVDREPEQEAFVQEVQSWSGGRFRESFSSPEELRDKVTRSLADLANAGLADEGEVSQRALASLPGTDRGSFGRRARLVVAVAGGPHRPILRPAELERDSLVTALQQDAMFSADAPLDRTAATSSSVDQNRIRLSQDDAELTIDTDGTVVITVGLIRRQDRAISIPSIIDEEVQARIMAGLRFAHSVLERIDPTHQLTAVVPAAAAIDADHVPWRTAAEVRDSPTSASMPMSRVDSEPVTLRPAMVPRAAISHDASRIAEDLTVLLRRQHR